MRHYKCERTQHSEDIKVTAADQHKVNEPKKADIKVTAADQHDMNEPKKAVVRCPFSVHYYPELFPAGPPTSLSTWWYMGLIPGRCTTRSRWLVTRRLCGTWRRTKLAKAGLPTRGDPKVTSRRRCGGIEWATCKEGRHGR